MYVGYLSNNSCDLQSICNIGLFVFGMGVGESKSDSIEPNMMRLKSHHSYHDKQDMGCMAEKSHDDVRAPRLLRNDMEWRFHGHCDFSGLYQMCVFPLFYNARYSNASLLLIIVDPNPRTSYVGCYATAASPIIFICWVLIFVYDLGKSFHFNIA